MVLLKHILNNTYGQNKSKLYEFKFNAMHTNNSDHSINRRHNFVHTQYRFFRLYNATRIFYAIIWILC
jgi:hypothetical protein